MERTWTGDSTRAVVTADFRHTPAAYEALTAALWRESELMEQLLFALTSQRLLLESGALRWLAASSAQINGVVEALREHELLRAVVTADLITELDVAGTTPLGTLCGEAPEPYAAILSELVDSLRGLSGEIDVAVRCNDELLLALVGPNATGRPGSCAP